jgi:hypothetical protein
MTRGGARGFLSVSLFLVMLARGASADEAAPLPAKDVRWSATLGGAADVGSLPRASTGLAFGFDARRGALAARGLTSVFAPVTESRTGATVALLDVMAMVCALAPVSRWFDAGACGGGGVGLLHAARSARSPSSGVGFRLEGLATARFDLVLSNVWSLSLESGTVLDPLRTTLPLVGAGDAGRASLVAFRGVLGIYLRVW